MFEFLLIFVPGLLALSYLSYLEKKELNFNYIMKNFPFCLMATNLGNYLILHILNGVVNLSFEFTNLTVSLLSKYLFMSIVTSVLVGLIFCFIKKHFDLIFEESSKKNGKK